MIGDLQKVTLLNFPGKAACTVFLTGCDSAALIAIIPSLLCRKTEKKIALSFDCAWGAEDFDSMMETLDKHNVKATFFMTGGVVSDNPECVKTLVEKGHEPGNHSEHHYDMATITAGEMKTEIMDVHKKVKELTGKDMKVFRRHTARTTMN